MSEVLRLHGLGAVVEVRCTGDAATELESAMRPAWSRCLSEPMGDVVEAERLVIRLDDPTDLPRRVMLTTQDVTRALIKARIGDLLMLHAGAVSDPTTGRSLVFVAAGGTGKTTMSRLLGRRFAYLTDETVGIDTSGTIHPYPKPLSVRRADEPAIKDELSPDDLDLLAETSTPHVARVVLLDRRPGFDGVAFTDEPFMDALFALVEQSSSVDKLDRPLHRLADLIDSTGPVVRVRYGEAHRPEADLMALISGTT